jgi:hypothetical protein
MRELLGIQEGAARPDGHNDIFAKETNPLKNPLGP